MPSKITPANINGQIVKLSNLEKILYHDSSLAKADFIQYMIQVSSHILHYVNGRPLTLIRYPDGLNGTKFYMKNKPTWTPEWIKSIRLGSNDDIDYVIANNQATLAWIANLASLEIHSMQVKEGTLYKPDLFVFDLDPPDASSFDKVKEIAFELKSFLEGYGYYPFVKTSGSKGIHIHIPINPLYEHDRLIKTLKDLAKAYIKINPSCTLKLNKQARAGKLLLDIYRNHKSQTTVIPYSTRARAGAPVSMPVSWEELKNVTSAQQYTMKTVPEILQSREDPWKDFYQFSVKLHDDNSPIIITESNLPNDKKKNHELEQFVDKNQLVDYKEKRDFTKTSEPIPQIVSGNNDLFVLQMHDASNLHYDLRLEEDGVLTSWAIPKGLPFSSGVKRLAIQTEDHPMKYIDFEGVIPKNEYGGGEMWVYDIGKYELLEKKDKKYKIKLHGKYIKGTYTLYKTKDNMWLTEKKDNFREESKQYEPMLAGVSKKLLLDDAYFYEIKWDGIRVMIYIDNHEVTIISRSGRVITKQFPEISQNADFCRVEQAVLDGEIVCLDEIGRPLFHQVISRMHTKGLHKIEQSIKSNPVYFYAFDLLELDGRDCTRVHQEKRKDWLKTILKTNNTIRISESMSDGKELFEATKQMGMEGIMIKKKKGRYAPGSRTNDWLKVKHRTRDIATIIGYTQGKGDRSGVFGALHMAKKDDKGKWIYMGKVGSGFDSDKLKKIHKKLIALNTIKKPIPDTIEEQDRTVWISPDYSCEIEYASMSSNNTYREPVFLKLIS